MLITGLRKIDNFFSQLARILTALCVFVQMIIMFVGVCFRYFINRPLTWTDEVATLLLVAVTFFGSYVALKDGILAKIDLLIDRLNGPTKKIVMFLSGLSTILLLLGMIYYGTKLGLSPTVSKQVSPALQMPMAWFFSIIPISGVMMLLHVVVEMYDNVFRRGGEDKC